MKYTHSEERFIAHCVAVARHNVEVDVFPGDVSDEGMSDGDDDGGDDGVQGSVEGGVEGGGEGSAQGGSKGVDGSREGGMEGGGEQASKWRGFASPSIVPCDTWEGDDDNDEADEQTAAEADEPLSANPFAAFAFR